MIRDALIVAGKDLRIELRSKSTAGPDSVVRS